MSKDGSAQRWVSRRSFLYNTAAAGGSLIAAATPIGRALAQTPAIITADSRRITMPYGVQAGDLSGDRAIVWSRADRPARMFVEVVDHRELRATRAAPGPLAIEDTDFTARLDLDRPARQASASSTASASRTSPTCEASASPSPASFRTPPASRRDVRFLWSGDTAGQGWGINPDFGGMKIYEAMRRTGADFFIHSRRHDLCRRPDPAGGRRCPTARVWKNLVTPEVAKVAETLGRVPRQLRYNLMDENLRRFNAEVPQFGSGTITRSSTTGTGKGAWTPTSATRRRTSRCSLAARRRGHSSSTRRCASIAPTSRERVYRQFGYGPLLDVFVLDMRSYRGPNSTNRQTAPAPRPPFLGPTADRLAEAGAARVAARPGK